MQVMDKDSINRQPEGTPAGGQFAEKSQREDPTVVLHGAVNESGAAPANGMPVLGTAANGYRDWVDDDGNLIKQVRYEGLKPNDAPDGTAAVILYEGSRTTEKHYLGGDLHDGSGDFPSVRHTNASGRVIVYRGYRERNSFLGFHEQDSPDGQPARVVAGLDGQVETSWMAAGLRQDPAPGVPGLTRVLPDGSTQSLHFPYGDLSDLDDGTPAVREWDPEGNLVSQVRYYGGWVCDGDDGDPALKQWRPDGSLLSGSRYWMGKQLPGANGEPAHTEYDVDGSVSSTTQDTRHFSFHNDPVPPRGKRGQDIWFARRQPVERHSGD